MGQETFCPSSTRTEGCGRMLSWTGSVSSASESRPKALETVWALGFPTAPAGSPPLGALREGPTCSVSPARVRLEGQQRGLAGSREMLSSCKGSGCYSMWPSVEIQAVGCALRFLPEMMLPRVPPRLPATSFAGVGGGSRLPPLGNPLTEKRDLLSCCSLKSSFVKVTVKGFLPPFPPARAGSTRSPALGLVVGLSRPPMASLTWCLPCEMASEVVSIAWTGWEEGWASACSVADSADQPSRHGDGSARGGGGKC